MTWFAIGYQQKKNLRLDESIKLIYTIALFLLKQIPTSNNFLL